MARFRRAGCTGSFVVPVHTVYPVSYVWPRTHHGKYSIKQSVSFRRVVLTGTTWQCQQVNENFRLKRTTISLSSMFKAEMLFLWFFACPNLMFVWVARMFEFDICLDCVLAISSTKGKVPRKGIKEPSLV